MISHSHATTVTFVLVAAIATACGDDGDPAGAGGSGGGNAPSTTTSQATTTSQSTTTTTTTSQGGGGGGDVCNPDPATPITIEVRNDSPGRLWLGWSNTDLRFVDVLGEGDPFCPCDQGMCPGGGVASVTEFYGYLEPGESISREWSGLFYDVPSRPECACNIGRAPSAGPITARAEAFALDCDPSEDAACDCPLATDGECALAESGSPLFNAPSLVAETTFAFPDEATVVVSFTEVPEG